MAHGSSHPQGSKQSLKSKPVEADEDFSVLGLRVRVIEERYNGHFVGLYDFPHRRGPFALFYTETPDVSQGHDNYFAFARDIGFTENGEIGFTGVYITNGRAIRDAKFSAIKLPDETFLVSRWHHDYVTGPNDEMLDGGCDYTRYNPNFPVTHIMTIVDGREVFTPVAIPKTSEASL